MSKRKVLIVDDNIQLAQTMKAGLEQTTAYEVRVENSATRARNTAFDFLPDIIILDVIMPEKDGGTVAAEIREDPALKDIPIIFATSIVGKNEAAAMGGRTGDDPVLAKPVTIEELTHAIERMLNQ